MKYVNIKGSITVELIVMLGLVASLTPILYKHISDRRQDIENINQANTLLLIRKATKEYLEQKKDNIPLGTLMLTPEEIGLDIKGYLIGIKKEDNENIKAMIVPQEGGSDLKAAKIASLIGVSAGIYSAQDTIKAWGINGVWAEDISNYGFSTLPTGIPVLTTSYDKTDDIDINQILDELQEESVHFKEICMTEDDGQEICIGKWSDIADIPGLKDSLREGATCQNDVDCMLSGSDKNLICLRPNGASSGTGSCANPLEIIEECQNGNDVFCSIGYSNALNRSCDQIRKTYTRMGKDPVMDSEQTYRIGVNASGGYRLAKCWFPSGTYTNNVKLGYEGIKAVLNACNTKKDLNACRAASAQQKHLNCNMTAYQYSVAGAPYVSPFILGQKNNVTMTLDDNGNTTIKECWFPDGYAQGSEKGYEGDRALLNACRGSDNFACIAAIRNNFNLYWCEGWKKLGYNSNATYPLFYSGARIVASCDMNKSPAWTNIALLNSNGSVYTAPYDANYGFAVKGTDYSSWWGFSSRKEYYTAFGGKASGNRTYSSGTSFSVKIIDGGYYKRRQENIWSGKVTWSEGGYGLKGVALYASGNKLLLVAGGAGTVGGGGGGWENGSVYTAFNECRTTYTGYKGSGLGGSGTGVGSGSGGSGCGWSSCRCASSCSGSTSKCGDGFGRCSKIGALSGCSDTSIPYVNDSNYPYYSAIYIIGEPSNWQKPNI